jgi:uncharacterized delta-60 repeat protein
VVLPVGISINRLTDIPTGNTTSNQFSIHVSGDNIVGYRFKYGPTASTDCGTLDGYSEEANSDTPISVDTAGFAVGEIRLCVIAKNAGGIWQSPDNATMGTWTKVLSLAAPLNLTATPSDNTATISWSTVTGATAYDLYVRSSAGVTLSDPLIQNVTSPYVHGDQTNGKRQFYAVVARDNYTQSPLSQEKPVIVGVPGAIENYLFGRHATTSTPFGNNTISTTNSNSTAYASALQSDGKLIVAGVAWRTAWNNTRMAMVRYHPDSSVDTSFGTEGIADAALDGSFRDVKILPDGKILALGLKDNGDVLLYRFLANGVLDTAFATSGSYTMPRGGSSCGGKTEMVVHSDLKTTVLCSSLKLMMFRIMADGTPDNTFGTAGVVTITRGGTSGLTYNAFTLTASGKYLAAGFYSDGGTNYTPTLTMVNADGTLDSSFGSAGHADHPSLSSFPSNVNQFAAVTIGVDGNIYTSPAQALRVFRFSPTGSLDTAYGNNGVAFAGKLTDNDRSEIFAQPDGKIIVAGGGTARWSVARFTTSGTTDQTFATNGLWFAGVGEGYLMDTIRSIAYDASTGSAILSGSIQVFGANTFCTIKLTKDGGVDTTYNPNGILYKTGWTTTDYSQTTGGNAMITLSDDSIVVAGKTGADGTPSFSLFRFQADGSQLTNWASAPTFPANSRAYVLTVQSDGKIVAGGQASNEFALARYLPDGTLDTTFDSDGKLITDVGSMASSIFAIGVQNGGKIVAAGTTTNSSDDFVVARYLSDGTLDTTFGTNGLVVAEMTSGARDLIEALLIQEDQKIILAGSSESNGLTQFAVMRLLPDGTLDTSFDVDGKVLLSFGGSGTREDKILAATLLPDGKIALAGYEDSGGIAIAVLNPDGSADTNFDSDGKLIVDIDGDAYALAKGIAAQPDGRLVVSAMSAANGNYRETLRIIRLNSNGTLDNGFGASGIAAPCFEYCPAGANQSAFGISLQSDGRIVVGANVDPVWTSWNSISVGLLRLIP